MLKLNKMPDADVSLETEQHEASKERKEPVFEGKFGVQDLSNRLWG